MAIRIGIDVGGTFTDAVLFDDSTGELRRAKVLTTGDDQAKGSLEAMKRLAGDLGSVDSFHHGYTVGLNATLTRSGAATAMLVTAGHRDAVDTGQVWRPFDDRLYDPNWVRPHQERPLVERRYRREIPQRHRADGEVLMELDEEATREQLEFLKQEGIESVGICFLHGYQYPEHEERVRELVAEVMPDAYVQTSKIWPLAREYERTFAVMLDAYSGPPVVRYLEQLEAGLREEGFEHDVEVMQMSGGTRPSSAVREAPVYTLQSGPVAGLLGAEYYSRELLNDRNLVCLDIGGTSSDLGVIHAGSAEVTNHWELEHAIPLSVTMLDVRSIGAGGGSIVHTDEVGSILVGPESAGSTPGPACYGRGGVEPAITDAYVEMGLLQPQLFLGGEMRLDTEAARAALGRVAEPLGLEPALLAQGAYELANVKIAAAVREMTIARGMDPRDFSLLAYGAAGGMHAVPVARELQIGEVVIPYFPGGFSAFGMIASRSRVEFSEAMMAPLAGLDLDQVNQVLQRLGSQCTEALEGDGVAPEEISLTFVYYGMYAGQGGDNRLPLPGVELSETDVATLSEDFHAFYDRRYGYRAPEIPIYVTSVTAVGFGPIPKITPPRPAAADANRGSIEDAVVHRATVHVDRETFDDVPFYDRDGLREGDEINGLAVIDDHLGTVVISNSAVARVVEHGTILVEV